MRKPALLLLFLLCFSEFHLFALPTTMVSAAHSKESQGESISEKFSTGGGRGGSIGGGGARGGFFGGGGAGGAGGGGSAGKGGWMGGGQPRGSGRGSPGYKSPGYVPIIVGAGAGAAVGAAAGRASNNHRSSAIRGDSHSSIHVLVAFGFVILALV